MWRGRRDALAPRFKERVAVFVIRAHTRSSTQHQSSLMQPLAAEPTERPRCCVRVCDGAPLSDLALSDNAETPEGCEESPCVGAVRALHGSQRAR